MKKQTSIKKLVGATATILTLVSGNALALVSMIPDAPSINAKGYVLMDYNSGEIIASSNPDQELAPASLTKMMTAYVIGQEINSGRLAFDDAVTISRNAWARNFPDSSKMFIEPGDEISVADLSRGIMIQSGNDASVAMAEHIAGSESAFVELMNNWAHRLGLSNSYFINAHGLDGQGIATSPRDMAVLTQRMISDTPDVYDIYEEKSFTWNGISQNNRNRLLWDNNLNVDGGKTGYTSNAGYSLVSSAIQDDMRLISVVMGTPSQRTRLEESRKLLTYGFRFFESTEQVKTGEALRTERLWMGENDQIELTVAEDIFTILPRGAAERLDVVYSVETPIKAPVEAGQVLGSVRWMLEDKTVREVDLISANDIEQGGLIDRFVDTVKLFFFNLKESLFA